MSLRAGCVSINQIETLAAASRLVFLMNQMLATTITTTTIV